MHLHATHVYVHDASLSAETLHGHRHMHRLGGSLSLRQEKMQVVSDSYPGVLYVLLSLLVYGRHASAQS